MTNTELAICGPSSKKKARRDRVGLAGEGMGRVRRGLRSQGLPMPLCAPSPCLTQEGEGRGSAVGSQVLSHAQAPVRCNSHVQPVSLGSLLPNPVTASCNPIKEPQI